MGRDTRYHPEWSTVSRYVMVLFNYYCSRCGKDAAIPKIQKLIFKSIILMKILETMNWKT